MRPHEQEGGKKTTVGEWKGREKLRHSNTNTTKCKQQQQHKSEGGGRQQTEREEECNTKSNHEVGVDLDGVSKTLIRCDATGECDVKHKERRKDRIHIVLKRNEASLPCSHGECVCECVSE